MTDKNKAVKGGSKNVVEMCHLWSFVPSFATLRLTYGRDLQNTTSFKTNASPHSVPAWQAHHPLPTTALSRRPPLRRAAFHPARTTRCLPSLCALLERQ